MPRTLVLLWAGAAAAQAQHTADLGSWADARHVKLTAPAVFEEAPRRYDADTVDLVETLLLEARAALDAGDPEAAREGLAHAARLLEASPVPQAAWLMAEVHLLEAERLAEGDAQAARSHLRAAAALGVERDIDLGPADAAPDSPPEPERLARIAGLRIGDVSYVDGLPREGVPQGRHHVRILRAGREVHASWVDARGPVVRVVTASPPPCSDRDLAGMRLEGDHVIASRFTMCPTWAVAREAGGGIEVATCHDHFCGPLLPWRASDGRGFSGEAQPAYETPGFPAWLGWTLAGFAAASATGVVLWQTGTFDDPEPGTTRFVVVPPERDTPR